MSFRYEPYNRYICSLQIVNPNVIGMSPYKKLYLPPYFCYKVKNILENGVRQRLNNNSLFLDYSKFLSSSGNAVEKSIATSKLLFNTHVDILTQLADNNPPGQLYTRKRIGWSKKTYATRMQRKYRSRQQQQMPAPRPARPPMDIRNKLNTILARQSARK
jgi:hypothetical protein